MLSAKLYKRPSGRVVEIDITEVDAHDAKFFEHNNVEISLEEIGPDDYVAYADIGATNADGEPDEVIVLSRGRSCRETLAELREKCEAALEQVERPFMKYGDGITLNGEIIEKLQELKDTLVNIHYVKDGPDGEGVYAYFTEHPDEGYMYLGNVD